MAITERQRHQLFTRVAEVLGPAEAETMMELMGPASWSELATKADLDGLRTELRADLQRDLTRVQTEMTRTFVGWMLTSQAAFTAIVAVFFTVAG